MVRLGAAIQWFFRILFGDGLRQLQTWQSEALESEAPRTEEPVVPEGSPAEEIAEAEARGGALILAQLQSESRLIDFLMEDISPYQDAQVGAAVRQVHSAARTYLQDSIGLERIRTESEGEPVVIQPDETGGVHLMGNVAHTGPWSGTLRHHGWQLPVGWKPETDGVESRRIARAEVEVHG